MVDAASPVPADARRNARQVVELLGAARPGTRVLVLCDAHTQANARLLEAAVADCGAVLSSMQIDHSAAHGRPLPDAAAAAMQQADLVIGITRANITHTDARRAATQAGVGVIVLPESDRPDFFLARGWDADFTGLRPTIEALADALTQASTARVVSHQGTDITMRIDGRRGRALHGFANTRDISAGYCLEASLAPVEGSANGVIVVNASIPGVARIAAQPVRIRIEHGMAVAIEGGAEAEAFRRLLQGFDDPLVYNLGELGVGMNPCCEIDGTMLSDESVHGAIQLALGSSLYIGGAVKAAAHYDTILTGAELHLDGKVVVGQTDSTGMTGVWV
ncbi:aminopeptidase [Bordetella sp. BOR01]|uniref:aminopeptidase n=1 Tax=Bordetella sp. BOR01 TaxID=2854779 RepID=UPI001C445557|nr:hypothetical protein [Bordetella sp. BOR01]MBV7483454.1 hypothetical protein [Bordetella sp. BOR01]